MPVTRSEYLIQLFSGRISELIFTLTLWSLFLIFFKFIRHRQQQRAYTSFRDHELHESLSEGIYVRDVEKRIIEISQFLEAKKVKKFQNSVIFRRIRRILYYLRAVPKKEEINTILNYQAEIDYNRMQTGYTLINVFIWAIPILGFIGTVFWNRAVDWRVFPIHPRGGNLGIEHPDAIRPERSDPGAFGGIQHNFSCPRRGDSGDVALLNPPKG